MMTRWLPHLVGAALLVSACSTASDTSTPATTTLVDATTTTTSTTVAPTTTTTLPGDGSTLTLARSEDSAGWFVAAVIAELATMLGYEVRDPAAQTVPSFAAYPSIASGDVDLFALSRYPDDLLWQEALLDDGTAIGAAVEVVATIAPGGHERGIVINRALAQDLALTSLDQIAADPAVAGLFDREGDGAADVGGCQFDSACAAAIDDLIAQNGWSTVTQTRGGYGALVNDAETRVLEGAPVLQYLERPTSHSARLVAGETVLWLAARPPVLVEGSTVDPQNCTADPCDTGFASSDLAISGTAGFGDAHPELTTMLAALTIDVADIEAAALLIERGADSAQAMRAHALGWIDDNREAVDRLVRDALASR